MKKVPEKKFYLVKPLRGICLFADTIATILNRPRRISRSLKY